MAKSARHGIYEVPIIITKGYNEKGCNSRTNNTLNKREFMDEKYKNTRSQREEVKRINKICLDNGIEPIDEAVFDFGREALDTIIKRKFFELHNLGITFADETRIKCSTCKYYQSNFSSCGKCTKHNRTTKAKYSCRFGEVKGGE